MLTSNPFRTLWKEVGKMLTCAAVLLGAATPWPALGAFGLVDQGTSLAVDSGAGLVFKVSKVNGNIVSIRYKGSGELQSKRGSHIASGFGSCQVTGELVAGDIAKITITTDERNKGLKGL